MSIISDSEFVEAFMQAYQLDLGLSELGETLGISRQGVFSRAKLLRQKGVRLPSLVHSAPGHRAVAVNELNDLVDAILKSTDKEV